MIYNIIFQVRRKGWGVLTTLKRFMCIFASAILVLFILPATAGAITVDGILESVEWKGTEKYVLISAGESSNCSIDFALMKIKVDNGNQAVYLGFQATQKQSDALEEDNVLAGIRLNLDGNGYILCTQSGISEYDINKYDINAKIIVGTNNDFTAEIRIGFKFSIPEKAVPGVQIVDGFGQPSNYYAWPVEPTTEATTTEKVTTTKKETTTKEPTTKKETTTKAPTTAKPITTKAPTTAKPTTTKAPTTAKPTTTKAPTTTAAQESTTAETTATIAATTQKASITTQVQAIISIKEPDTNQIYRTTASPSTTSAATSYAAGILSQTGAEEESSDPYEPATVNESAGINRAKQILAIAVAVLLIAAAVCLSIFAGRPQKKSEPSAEEPRNETDTDDDF